MNDDLFNRVFALNLTTIPGLQKKPLKLTTNPMKLTKGVYIRMNDDLFYRVFAGTKKYANQGEMDPILVSAT